MTDKHITVDSIRWRSVLPWLHLLRAAQLGLRVRVLLLGLLALLVYGQGCLLLRSLPFHDGWHSGGTLFEALEKPVTRESVRIYHLSIDPRNASQSGQWLSWPWNTVVSPSCRLFDFGGSWSRVATAWTHILWSLLIWAVFGGAMARMSAVRFARDESVSLRAALTFSIRNWQSYLYGPLLPMLLVGLFAAIGSGIGWLDQWLSGGQGHVLDYLGFIPLFCGLAMGLLLILMALSWPLMVVAISAEGSDGFDGLSRGFGYVMNRPWYLLWLIAASFGVGLITNYAMWWLLQLAERLGHWTTAHATSEFWLDAMKLGHLAVLVSFFWSATTVIYFLLRLSDDGTPLDQVYISGPPPKAEKLPIVGVAASQQPVIERPVTQTGEAAPT